MAGGEKIEEGEEEDLRGGGKEMLIVFLCFFPPLLQILFSPAFISGYQRNCKKR